MTFGDSSFASASAGFTRAELLVALAGLAVLVAALAPAFKPAARLSREESELAFCRENLRKIGISLLAYAQDNTGALPLSATVDGPHPLLLQSVATPKYVSDPKLFYCPGQRQPDFSFSPDNFKAGIIGYFYYSAAEASPNDRLSKFLLTGVSWPRALNTHLDARSWVMSDIWFSGDPTAHTSFRKGVNYLMLDGAVDFVAESPRQAFH